jgi:glycosyltransferase involved in cell wall biosynthesis
MPRVTVVLPVYNHDRYVQKALDSLFAQDYSDYQIVAVDDGSMDDSLEILNRNRPRISVIETAHRGPAAARNQAIAATDSEFVAFMDADDLCSPERLRLSVDALDKNGVDLVASALSFMDSAGNILPGGWRCPAEAHRDFWGALLERNWIGTPSVTVRRTALEAAGGFDESFFHAEDYDLWLRIGESHSLGFIDTPLIQCRRHPSNTSMNFDAHRYFERLALQKVARSKARQAFCRLHASAKRSDEAWIWFLLRSGDASFLHEAHAAIAEHPVSLSLWFAMGIFQYDRGNYADSLNAFQSFKESDTVCLHNAGVVMGMRGDTAGALSHIEKALRLRPDYYDAAYNVKALQTDLPLRLTRRQFREQLIAIVTK